MSWKNHDWCCPCRVLGLVNGMNVLCCRDINKAVFNMGADKSVLLSCLTRWPCYSGGSVTF